MQGDTKKFHNAFLGAGFRPNPYAEPIKVYSDLRKSGIRRIKLVDGEGVFHAPQFVQHALEQSFKNVYGDRYLGGEFIERSNWWAYGKKSFVIYLLEA